MSIFAFIVVGILAGWIAGLIMRGHGFGMVADLIIGIIGAVIGGLIFDFLDITAYGFMGSLTMSVIGAVILLGFSSVMHRA